MLAFSRCWQFVVAATILLLIGTSVIPFQDIILLTTFLQNEYLQKGLLLNAVTKDSYILIFEY